MKGFTLIELLVVIVIFSIILGGTYTTLILGQKTFQSGDVQIVVQQEARKAMNKVVTELREASSVNLADPFPFTISGSRINYIVVGTQLQKVVELGPTTILANNVGDIQFTLIGGNMLYIAITTQKNTIAGHPLTATLTSQVRLRN